jgi:outer membrane cobalamin receptor
MNDFFKKDGCSMRRKSLTGFIFLCAFWAAGAAVLHAEEFTEEAYRLGEVVVSEPRAGVEAAATVHTVTAKEIKAMGARTLDEALTLVPGVVLRTGGEGTPRIDIRGFRTRHVLLLLDGTPINSTFDGQFDPSTFGVENIAEIKVTTGGASVLYGEGGNGGVINIITKKGRDGIHGSVNGEAAEGDAYLGRFTLGAGTGTVDAFVSGSAYDRDGWRLSDDFSSTADENGGERLNSDRERENLFANLGWAPSEKTQFGLTFNYRSDEFGSPPVTNFDASDPFSKKPKFDRVDDLEGYAIQFAFDQQLPGPFSTRGWVYFNVLDMLENRYDDATFSTQAANGAFSTDSTTEIAGANVQFIGDLQQYGTTTLALMVDNSDWEADGFRIVKSGKNLATETFDLQRDLQQYTAALQYEANPLEKLGIVLGTGWHLQRRDDHSEEKDYSYEVGAHYDLFSGTRLRASHARKIRFPSIRQLYEVGTGTSDLEAERTLHYEAGVEQQFPVETLVSLTAFLIDAEDFIEKNDVTDRFENFEEYRFKGFEIGAENRYVENLMLRVAYSYLDSENRSTGRDELQYRPRDKFTVEGRYRFPWGMTAYGSLLYVGHQYFYNSVVPPVQKKRLNDYTVVDVKVSQDLLDDRLGVYVGVNNLFDEDYEQSYGLPQPGRTLYAGATYRF